MLDLECMKGNIIRNYDCVKIVERWCREVLLAKNGPAWRLIRSLGFKEYFNVVKETSHLLYNEFKKRLDQLAGPLKSYTYLLSIGYSRNVNDDFNTVFDYATKHLLSNDEFKKAIKKYNLLMIKTAQKQIKREDVQEST